MKPVLVVCASREGHTEKLADQVVHCIEATGREALRVSAKQGEFHDCDAVFLASSVHLGQHEPSMVDYVRYNRHRLLQVPTAFLSVSLHEAVNESSLCSPLEQDDARAEVNRALEFFYEETGWRPDVAHPVAGALAYSRYGFLKRIVMQRMAREKGLSVDTSRDHDYTNWTDLCDFVGAFLDAHCPIEAAGQPA